MPRTHFNVEWPKMKLILFLSTVTAIGVLGLLIWANFPSLPNKTYKQGQLFYFPSPSNNETVWTPDTPIKTMTYNLGFGGGENGLEGTIYTQKDVEKNLSDIKNTILSESPDILAVQEIDLHSKRSYFIDEVKYIARTCKYPYVAMAYTWDKNWVPYPFFTNPKYQFGKILAGQAIFSKYPISKQEILRFNKPSSNNGFYNLFYLDRVLQTIQISLSKTQSIRISNIHLEAFDKKERAKQAKYVLRFLEDPLPKIPQILMGDLNAVDTLLVPSLSDSKEFHHEYEKDKTLSILRQAKTLREILDKLPTKTQKNYKTYPTSAPKVRLDYIFYSQTIVPTNITLPKGTGSDHKPISATFKL